MIKIDDKYKKTFTICSMGGKDGHTPLVSSKTKALYFDNYVKNEIFDIIHCSVQTIDSIYCENNNMYYIEFKNSSIKNININEIEGKIVCSLIILSSYCDIDVFDKKNKFFIFVVANELDKLNEFFNMKSIISDIINKKSGDLCKMLNKYQRYFFNLYEIENDKKYIFTSSEFKKYILHE